MCSSLIGLQKDVRPAIDECWNTHRIGRMASRAYSSTLIFNAIETEAIRDLVFEIEADNAEF